MDTTVKSSDTNMAACENRFGEAGFRQRRLLQERISKRILSGFEYNYRSLLFLVLLYLRGIYEKKRSDICLNAFLIVKENIKFIDCRYAIRISPFASKGKKRLFCRILKCLSKRALAPVLLFNYCFSSSYCIYTACVTVKSSIPCFPSAPPSPDLRRPA